MTTRTSIITISTIKDLAHAMVLGDSIQQNLSNVDFRIVLADNPQHIPSNFTFPHPIIPIDTFAPSECTELKDRYSKVEFLRNLKPIVLQYFLNQYDSVIYTDVQTVFYQSLASIEPILNRSNILLCPQLLHAGKHPNEKESLNTGIFHAGFIGLTKSEETGKFLDWWRQNCIQKGYIKLCDGLNAEQLWLEHVPAMFERVEILKNPGVNLGKWNEKERNIEQLKANNQIISVNYSGNKFPKSYEIQLNQYHHRKLKIIIPEYGIPEKKIKKTEIIAKKIRNSNLFIDKIIDKLVELFIEK